MRHVEYLVDYRTRFGIVQGQDQNLQIPVTDSVKGTYQRKQRI